MDEIIRRVRAALPPLVVMTGLLTGQATIAFAHDPGQSGDGTGAAGCGRCHSGGSTGTAVVFGGAPASVDVNSMNTLTFTISGGPASNAGLSITASDGTLAAIDGDATILAGELVHTNSAMMTGGSKVYTFTWTAPATAATVTLTGAGVSGDSDGSTSGDGAAKTSITISVAGGGTTPTPSGGEQLYDDNCASCHGAGGVGGADGDVVGESASDIAEAILEVPVMNSLSVLTAEEIDAIAAYLNGGCVSGEDDDDRLVARRSSVNPLDDDEAGGSCAGINTAATKKSKAAAIAGGAFDVLTLAGISLLWGRWRKK